MENISENVMEIVVTCIYTSEFGDLITEDNVQDVLEAANFLEVLHLQQAGFSRCLYSIQSDKSRSRIVQCTQILYFACTRLVV